MQQFSLCVVLLGARQSSHLPCSCTLLCASLAAHVKEGLCRVPDFEHTAKWLHTAATPFQVVNIAALQILYEKYLDFLLLCLIGGLKCRNEQIRVIFSYALFWWSAANFYLCNFSFGITLWVFAIKKTLCCWFYAWPAAIVLCLDSIILCVVWLLQTNRISTGYQYIFKWPM